MQTNEFIERVHQRGPEMGKSADPMMATAVTLQALCEHLPADEANKMADQLSDTLAEAARAGGNDTEASRESISLDDFYRKIASRANLERDDATGYARAVAQTLKEAISAGEITDVAFELPLELPELIAYE